AVTLASGLTFADTVILAVLSPTDAAAFSYASRIPIGLHAIASTIASTRLIHIFSESIHRGNTASTFRQCMALCGIVLTVTALLAIVLDLNSVAIISQVFQRGEFDASLTA